jgi:hypothetical protein
VAIALAVAVCLAVADPNTCGHVSVFGRGDMLAAMATCPAAEFAH